jgi:ribosome-associated protein
MKPNETDESQDSAQDRGPLSKTKRKAAMDALQDLGGTLVGLSKDKLAKLDLPEALLDAVNEAKRITANGATRRQMQYIGKLMREVDTDPIKEQLARWEGKNVAENAHFHRLERWRTRLIEEEAAFAEWLSQYPQTDTQQLRTLIRNARREQAANKPPKSSREIFRLLREISEASSLDDASTDDSA